MRCRVMCVVAVIVAWCSAGVAQAQTPQWRQPVQIVPAAPGYNVTPLSGDGGRLLVVWQQGVSNGSPFLYRLRPTASAPFGPPKQLVPYCSACAWLGDFRVAMNSTGQAIAVWRRTDPGSSVWKTHSVTIDANGVVGSPEIIDVPNSASVADVGIDSAGKGFLVAQDDGGRATVWTRPVAGPWGSPTTLSPNPSRGRLAIAGQHVAVALSLDNDCGIQISRLNGDNTWTSQTPDDEPACDRAPNVGVSADGTVDAIWETVRGTRYVVKTASAGPGATFTAPQVLDDHGPTDSYVALAIRRLADGRVVAAWTLDTPEVAVRTRVGGSWSPRAKMHWGYPSIDHNGAVIAGSIAPAGSTRMEQGQAPRTRVLRPTGWLVGGPALASNGDVGVIVRDLVTRALWLYEFTGRPLPRLVDPPPPYPVRLASPDGKRYPAGSVVPLTVTLSNRGWYGLPVRVRVQQLRAGRWVTTTTRAQVPSNGIIRIRVRPRFIGLGKLRVMAGNSRRATSAITIELRTPRYRRIPVGVDTDGIRPTQSGLWINEGRSLRLLHPVSGATVRRRALPTSSFGWRGLEPLGSTAFLVGGREGDRVGRVDTATGKTTVAVVDGGFEKMSSNGRYVWMGRSSRGVQLDPQTLTPTGVSVAFPGADVEDIVSTGSRVWFTTFIGGGNEREPIRELYRVNAATGATEQHSTGSEMESYFPITDNVFWENGVFQTVRTPAGYDLVTVARSGDFVWMLQRRQLKTLAMSQDRLAQYRLNGTPTGKAVTVGEVNGFTYNSGDVGMLSVRNNVAWIHYTSEATVVRVPLP